MLFSFNRKMHRILWQNLSQFHHRRKKYLTIQKKLRSVKQKARSLKGEEANPQLSQLPSIVPSCLLFTFLRQGLVGPGPVKQANRYPGPPDKTAVEPVCLKPSASVVDR